MSLIALDNSLGAVLIGSYVACFLFGLITQQAYMYFQSFPEDPKWIKLAVTIVWALEGCHLSSVLYWVYRSAITNFGNYEALIPIGWDIKFENTIEVIIILLVQALYTCRLWCLRGRGPYGEYVCYMVSVMVLGGTVFGILYLRRVYMLSSWSELADMAWILRTSYILTMIVDLIIAMAMCYYLRKSKSRFPKSTYNSKVSKLMLYTLGCGLLTSAFSLAGLTLYLVFPNDLIFFGSDLSFTKSYGICYLYMLNARTDLRAEDIDGIVHNNPYFASDPTPSTPSLVNKFHSITSSTVSADIERGHHIPSRPREFITP